MKITVFTPTFNRGYVLENAYQSLCNQTYKDFEWLIMDDGSTDNTNDLVKLWIDEELVRIRYLSQSNQGRFKAYNNAVDFADGELFLFLDSNDSLIPTALEMINQSWNINKKPHNCTGILAYEFDKDGTLIAEEFPDGLDYERYYTLYDKYHMRGDKCVILRTDLAKLYKYTEYEGEKFIGDSIIFIDINKHGPMLLLREKIYFKTYAADGLTKNLKKHHLNSPNGMADHYWKFLEVEKYDIISIYKHAVGYLIFGKLAKRTRLLKNSPNKIITILAYPTAIVLLYTKYRTKQ